MSDFSPFEQHAVSREHTVDVDERGAGSETHLGQARMSTSVGITRDEEKHLRRGLEQRHLSMISLAGSIGTGLFLSLGVSLATAGPIGALLGYITVGLIVVAVQLALGEVSALLPVTGSFLRHADFLIDPAVGFAVGWNVVCSNALSIPSEISAICVLFRYWTDVDSSIFIMFFVLLTFLVGIGRVRVFGEIEFVFGFIKMLTMILLIVFGLVINLGGVPGGEMIGFRYWKYPGPFAEYLAKGNCGKFLGYWSVMSNAVFSFAGVESLAMAAAETRNPSKAIPRACKRVIVRVVVFYLLAVLVVGMLVASDDPGLKKPVGTAAQSPFILALSNAHYPAVGSVVNAVVIASAWSSSNQALLAGTRVLYALALRRQAPRIFLRTTSWGNPYVCVLFVISFTFLSFMTLSTSALTVFYWFVALTAAGKLIAWGVILTNHIRLRVAMRRQCIPLSQLPWHNSWTIYTSCAGLFACVLILFTGGFAVFMHGNWNANSFVSSYLDIPLVIIAFVIWKWLHKTKYIELDKVPIREAFEKTHIRLQRDKFTELHENRPAWLRYISWIWD